MQPEDTTPVAHASETWPGDSRYVQLRAQWDRCRRKIRDLEHARRDIDADLETARHELARLAQLAAVTRQAAGAGDAA